MALDKPVDSYRNKKVFDFGFSDPTRIEVIDGDEDLDLRQEPARPGRPAERRWIPPACRHSSTACAIFRATKFADSGFTTPVVTLTVVSNQGKLREQVEIAPAASGGNFLARTAGDASFYELEANVVKELRQAVGDVREAQPETKKK